MSRRGQDRTQKRHRGSSSTRLETEPSMRDEREGEKMEGLAWLDWADEQTVSTLALCSLSGLSSCSLPT